VPLILSVHGGPHNYFGDDFAFDHQLYAAMGYAVLYVNPRGSGGSGETFARAVVRDWGGEDFADLLAMVDDLLASEPGIDPQRVGIIGGSYGGYMTCWAVTRTDRFAAAVAVAPITNLISSFGTSDAGVFLGLRELGGTPDERREWYLDRSPLTHAPRVRTPLLLCHGEADLRCPIAQSEEMFTALLRLGKTVALLRLPGEAHHHIVDGTPAHRVAGCQAVLDWFGMYLRGQDV
jgi:dipeptidyl aminopeptidase/acylaminoacyl peptidase